MIGKDKIIMGSDYPFPLGEVTGSAKNVFPGCHVDDAEFLSEEEKEQIFSGNALEFMGLDEADFLDDGSSGGGGGGGGSKRSK